jgi:plasmid stabilization system protein ParE
MAQIHWSSAAEDDLKTIEEIIAKDSIFHAIAFVDRLIASIEKISHDPFCGAVVQEFGQEDLREIIYKNYRLVYRLHEDMATVLAVSFFFPFCGHERRKRPRRFIG